MGLGDAVLTAGAACSRCRPSGMLLESRLGGLMAREDGPVDFAGAESQFARAWIAAAVVDQGMAVGPCRPTSIAIEKENAGDGPALLAIPLVGEDLHTLFEPLEPV